MTLTGNVGIKFDLTESAVTTPTGTITQEHKAETSISELTILATDLVYSISGTVGTTAFDLDLNAIDNQSGTGYTTTVVRNNGGDLSTLKHITINNTHVSNVLTIGSPAANSLLTWNSTSDSLAIPSGGSFTFQIPNNLTIATNGKLNIVGSAASTTFEVLIFGA